MKVSFHGHSVVKVETGDKTILFDPFITGNSETDLRVSDVKPDVIILTHGHDDHVGDTITLAKEHNSLVIANFEIATILGWQGVENTHGMSIGGAHDFDFGRVKLTPAFHGSGMTIDGQMVYGGQPAGILLTIEGKTIYHVGDTALYSDMKLIGQRHPIDLAFVPIGDNFTMGPEDAALAVEFLNPKQVVPIHYNTFPVIGQDPQKFIELLPKGVGLVLQPGEAIDL
ncbi:metal-dependent hydrolase [Bacillus massiliigorillae]|uniref:metal-dependent hydrolase n=1 Tax=Bacillus massiliigorillae TaxID=1243664 RepID=UPI00039FF00D|nr:metal-dependent hydrolase [Bacillus massiliigorillae]